MYNPALNKKIYDAVHGFIRFNELERELIDSEPFQRLHYLHQLGIAFLVYPGATHTRFEHSLGAMELATRIFDRIISKYPQAKEIDVDYWRQILRLAALCHDLGHLPFSHAAEKNLLGEGGHEKWTVQVIKSPDLLPIWEHLQERYPEKNVVEDLIKMALGESKVDEMGLKISFTSWEKVMSQVITGDFFGADRIDYLLRDAQCTGVSYGLFDYHQLIEMLCILPSLSQKEGELELGIEENGVESCEALLLARHFMHQRVYQYPSVKSYTFHLARFMQLYYEKGQYLQTLDDYLSLTDNEILSAIRQASKNPAAVGHEDAVAILQKQHRFLAVEKSIEEETLEKKGLEFPLLTRTGEIILANKLSKLEIPSGKKNWTFLSPKEALDPV